MTTPTTRTGASPPSTAAQASLYQTLRQHLAVLKLDACAEALPRVPDEATAEKLSVTATLERLLSIEVNTALARRLVGRLRFACLPTPATLDDFDYDAQPGVDRTLINELATCRYLDTATNVLMIGPPGVGNTSNPPPDPTAKPSSTPRSHHSATCAISPGKATPASPCTCSSASSTTPNNDSPQPSPTPATRNTHGRRRHPVDVRDVVDPPDHQPSRYAGSLVRIPIHAQARTAPGSVRRIAARSLGSHTSTPSTRRRPVQAALTATTTPTTMAVNGGSERARSLSSRRPRRRY